jgi:hypothetical protein
MSYNSVSTIIALIPGITITALFLFGNSGRVTELIKRKSSLAILALFCAIQIILHVLHSPLVYKFLASISVTTAITILYVLKVAWPLVRLLR